MNKKRGLLWLAICICFIGLYSLSSYAMLSEDRVIKVGFPIQGGLTQKDKDGNYSGYTYDYLQEIAQYTGWEYEFIEVPGDINESLTVMLEMLENGEIDIMGGMVKNEHTQKSFGFPEYGYGLSYTTLYASEKNTRINENSFQNKKGLKIAVYKSSTFTREKVKAYCELNNIDYQEIEKDTELEMVEALERGEVDVAVGNSLMPLPGMRTIAQFNGTQYYFATPKGNYELLGELNRTILTIQQTKPDFDSSLHNKYFINLSNKVYFSEEENVYIKSADPIRIVLLTSFEPIQFVDKDGNTKGIGKDILDRIKSETGLRFEYVFAKDFTEAYQLLSEGKADAVCGISYDYALAQQNGMIMSNSFLTAQMVRVSMEAKVEAAGKSVGLLNESKPLKKVGQANVRQFDTVLETMEAVVEGDVDYAYLNLYSAEYLGHLPEFKGIRMIPQSDNTTDFCIGIKKPVDTMLVSVINKVLHNISSSEIEAIIYQNTTDVQGDVTLTTFIETNPMLSIAFISVLSLCALFIIGLVYWIQMRAVKRLDVESRRYMQLCELANEYIYEYDLENDKLTCSKEFAGLFAFPSKIEKFSAVTENGLHLPGVVSEEIFYSLKPILINQSEKEAEHLCIIPSGEWRWYRNTQAKIKTSSGDVRYIIGKLTDIQSEKLEKEILEQRVMRDGLTGIYNSVTSKELIDQRLKVNDKCAAMLIIDLDVFKQVNDTLGHFTGDLVLRDFAQLLEKLTGSGDIAGRIGGDEFVLFLEDAKDYQHMEKFCNSLCKSARRTYVNDEGKTYLITISIGAAVLYESCNYFDVYQYTDRELYRAKNTGRDCYCMSEYNRNSKI